jgi:hypothetical protein
MHIYLNNYMCIYIYIDILGKTAAAVGAEFPDHMKVRKPGYVGYGCLLVLHAFLLFCPSSLICCFVVIIISELN